MARIQSVSERIFMKKFLSIVLVLVMLLSAVALTSCSKPEEKVENAELVFEELSYKMNMKTTFSSSDAELNALLAAKATEIPVIYDNDIVISGNKSSAMSIEVAKNPIGTISPVTFTVADSALFLKAGMLKNEEDVQVLLANSDRIKFFDSFNARFIVDDTYFEDCDVEKDGKKKIYTFSGISEDGKIELKYALRRILLGIYDEYSLDFADCSYAVTISNKKIEKAVLVYSHNVTVNGNTVPVTVTMVADYSYDNVPDITEPEGYYERMSSFDEYFQ